MEVLIVPSSLIGIKYRPHSFNDRMYPFFMPLMLYFILYSNLSGFL